LVENKPNIMQGHDRFNIGSEQKTQNIGFPSISLLTAIHSNQNFNYFENISPEIKTHQKYIYIYIGNHGLLEPETQRD